MKNHVHHPRRSLLRDLFAAVKLTMALRREERKKSAENIRDQPTQTVPRIKSGYWGWTGEAMLTYPKTPKGTEGAVVAIFKTFDEETQHALTFTPYTSHDWLERAKFWQQALKPHLPPKQYSAAMLTMLAWYIKCCKRFKKASDGHEKIA